MRKYTQHTGLPVFLQLWSDADTGNEPRPKRRRRIVQVLATADATCQDEVEDNTQYQKIMSHDISICQVNPRILYSLNATKPYM